MSTEKQRPYIGGQAVIEGVMMRSPSSVSIVCRRKNGELVVRERPMPGLKKGPRSWPFVRGLASVGESLKLGMNAMRWAADLYEKDLEEEEGGGTGAAKKGSSAAAAIAMSIVALATRADDEPVAPAADDEPKKGPLAYLPFLVAIFVFVFLPQAFAELVTRVFKLDLSPTSPGYQVITGVGKLCIVIGYMLLIRRIPLVRSLFQYHGAEHKAISTYEAGQDLVVPNARKMTTMHPRCGTTFLVMVALVSIGVFTSLGFVLPHPEGNRLVLGLAFFVAKLPFLPVIASITFEIQRLFARYCTTGPLRVLLYPGFLVQKITTAEPDDTQLEIALASLQATLWREAAVDAPPAKDRVFADYEKLLADPGYARA